MGITSMNMGRTPASSSRNIAFMTIFSVIGGGYALLRYQSPRGNQGIVKEDDIANETGATKLGRSKIVSRDEVNATMGDASATAHKGGNIGRSQRKASGREDI